MNRKHSNSKHQQQYDMYSIKSSVISIYRSDACASIWLKIKDTIWCTLLIMFLLIYCTLLACHRQYQVLFLAGKTFLTGVLIRM